MSDLHVRPADDAGIAAVVRLRDDAARWMPARREGKPQPGGTPKSFTLLEKPAPGRTE
ncbi:hypothetical protein OG778_35445 (plasmid) [Streptomyces sp. NBC_00184]|uniref:hypothetical protein n=1 Tax=Streptomyces sp. NBC_00184 TaxID=2975673 RepID=UPI002E27C085|nr:hypothetical protein [Streptomyces sp. NBC_00184]